MSIIARHCGRLVPVPSRRETDTQPHWLRHWMRLAFALAACVAIGMSHAALALPPPWNWVGCAWLVALGVGLTRAAVIARIPGRRADEPAPPLAGQDAFMRDLARLERLRGVARAVVAPADLAPTLAYIGEHATSIFGARSFHVLLPGPTASTIDEVAGFDRDNGPFWASRLAIPLEGVPSIRQALARRGAVSVGDPVLRQLALAIGVVPDLCASRRLLIVPLRARGDAIGAMTLGIDQAGRDFTADECRLAETIAADIAASIENARLVERERASAVAEERARLARELHDSVTQSLYSIAIVAEALPRVFDREPTEAMRNADYLRNTTLGALAELRTLLFELRPSSLAAAKLSTLLHQQADALRGRTRIAVEVTVNGDADVPPDAKLGLYRIAQEVFNNIARHAQATRVVAELRASPRRIAIMIADDGVGFAPGAAPADRMGLLIMRERAQAIGAHLRIASTPGQGTRVTLVWPVGQAGLETPQPEAGAPAAMAVCDDRGALHHLTTVPETALGAIETAQ